MPLPLLHSPDKITCRVLTDIGQTTVGKTTDPAYTGIWPCNYSTEPPTPDNCVTCYTTQGQDDGRVMLDGSLVSHYGVQIRVRSIDNDSGAVKAQAIRAAISEDIYDHVVSIDDARYVVHSFNKINQVLSIGKESPNSKRNIFTINTLVKIRRVS